MLHEAKPEDLVSLVFVTKTNFVWAYNLRRGEASDIMRNWYEGRECWNRLGWFRRLWWRLRFLGTNDGTFATNYSYTPGDLANTFAGAVVGWEHVVGMYLSENTSSNQKLADAQMKIANAMEKQMDPDGDQPWKKGGDEDE